MDFMYTYTMRILGGDPMHASRANPLPQPSRPAAPSSSTRPTASSPSPSAA